jgi:hypothetical protein
MAPLRRSPRPYLFATLRAACVSQVLLGCGEPDLAEAVGGPVVVRTVPADGDTDVDASLPALSVTFSEAMLREGWSWVTELEHAAPEVTGAAFYVDDVTNMLPVQLLPQTSYVVWVNSPDDERLRKFASAAGVAARAYRIRFRTR